MSLIAKKVNFSRTFCEMITFKTPTAWDRLDTTLTHTWSSAHSFSLSESHFFLSKVVSFFNSTSNWNRIFRCINTFVPRCCTWFLGSGLSHQIFCSVWMLQMLYWTTTRITGLDLGTCVTLLISNHTALNSKQTQGKSKLYLICFSNLL